MGQSVVEVSGGLVYMLYTQTPHGVCTYCTDCYPVIPSIVKDLDELVCFHMNVTNSIAHAQLIGSWEAQAVHAEFSVQHQ